MIVLEDTLVEAVRPSFARMSAKQSFNVGDRVFAKVRGYPPWPARVSGFVILHDKTALTVVTVISHVRNRQARFLSGTRPQWLKSPFYRFDFAPDCSVLVGCRKVPMNTFAKTVPASH